MQVSLQPVTKKRKPNLDTIFNYVKEKNPIISNDD